MALDASDSAQAGRAGQAGQLAALERSAHEGTRAGQRRAACRTIGALAGRAWDVSWETAERAAFALLEVARDADAPAERIFVLEAMGLGFRNAWFMPYVHSRLFDDDDRVVEAAISAAGGLAFPALEAMVAGTFLDAESPFCGVAIAALGRMGSVSAAPALAGFVHGDHGEAAFTALTEIRSPVAREAALERRDLVAAVRYLAEIGEPAIEETLRILARDERVELRLVANEAMRSLEAERRRDAGERILVALTERDRALRSRLARRLRTLPVAEVLEAAEVLLADDPSGLIQVVAEVRSPEVTHFLLRIANDESLDVAVRARAAGSVEADEAWERDALADLVASKAPPRVRVAAAQTLGAFAPISFVLDRLAGLASDPAPAVRGALLWAIQLAARPRELAGAERARAEAEVRRGLEDEDAAVRRRAAYVAGNVDASALVPELALAARSEDVQQRIAAFVALGDIASPARFADLVHLWNREDEPAALGAASRALERSLAGEAEPASQVPASLGRVSERLPKLLASSDPRVRAAAARVAGLAGVSELVAPLLEDGAPRVRENAVIALGRGGPAAYDLVVVALDDPDPTIQERAAEALLTIDAPRALAVVLDFVVRTTDRPAAARLATRVGVMLPKPDMVRLDVALGLLDHDDAAYETLVDLKLASLERARPAAARTVSTDDAITALFPMWPKLSVVRAFAPLARSLRTAETLFASSMHDEADLSAAIVLWMKCLEGYLHAWLTPKLRAIREATLWELTDRMLGSAWPPYQRWLGERWADPVLVGKISVDLPLRSVVNALRDLQARRVRLDSPMSVTEWSRLLLFLGVEHSAGAKNVLGLTMREPERTVRLAHKLHVLAQVRNAVTHRSTADAETLGEFRRLYYAAFDELTRAS